MAIQFTQEEICGHLEDFERWDLLDLVPQGAKDAMRKRGLTFISIVDDINVEKNLPSWDTGREFSHTEVLEKGRNYIVLKNRRCTVNTGEKTIYRTSILALPAVQRIRTNMWMPDSYDIAVYVEAYGTLPCGDLSTPGVREAISNSPKKIWDHFGNELPSDLKVHGNIYDWQDAFKSGSAA